jgi:cell division protein FtsN
MNCIWRIEGVIGRQWGAFCVMVGAVILAAPLAGQAPTPAAVSCPVPSAVAETIAPGRVSVAAAAGDVASKPSGPSAPSTLAKGGTAAKASSSPYQQWSVQVASYETLLQAQTLQQSLCQRGFDARVVGASRPYSVRVGRFATSRDALVVARRLRSPGLTVFVTPEWR